MENVELMQHLDRNDRVRDKVSRTHHGPEGAAAYLTLYAIYITNR